ncbi:MAG TPA: polymer-forming cytoskeletal protein [Myxococcales bacterium]|jgi:cytoskeletal protein CcmA (bactofilin family)
MDGKLRSPGSFGTHRCCAKESRRLLDDPALAAKEGPLATTDQEGALSVRLDRACALEGTLTFQGEGRIAGRFTGKIISQGSLWLEQGAVVKAEIQVATVVVLGEVEGNIKATASVELKPGARVRGDIETPVLVIERGAVLEGKCHMELGKK